MSRDVRKPCFCICENKDADQLRGNSEADQCLCFPYIDSTIPLLAKYIIMPPTLKKLMGHIAFGACVGGCVRGWVTLFVPTVTFKPLKLES